MISTDDPSAEISLQIHQGQSEGVNDRIFSNFTKSCLNDALKNPSKYVVGFHPVYEPKM